MLDIIQILLLFNFLKFILNMEKFDNYIKNLINNEYDVKFIFDLYKIDYYDLEDLDVYDVKCKDYSIYSYNNYSYFGRCYTVENINFRTAKTPYRHYINGFMIQIGYININDLEEFMKNNYLKLFRDNVIKEYPYGWLLRNSKKVNVDNYIKIKDARKYFEDLEKSDEIKSSMLINYLSYLRYDYFSKELIKLSKKYKFQTTRSHYKMLDNIRNEIFQEICYKTITEKEQVLDYYIQTFYINFLIFIKGVYNEKFKSTKN